uniref:Uncharacterized protein n=1 Tax=Onchocerca volvulus TaxID=6282 RepID=A0A8R1XWC6_ONCVO
MSASNRLREKRNEFMILNFYHRHRVPVQWMSFIYNIVISFVFDKQALTDFLLQTVQEYKPLTTKNKIAIQFNSFIMFVTVRF